MNQLYEDLKQIFDACLHAREEHPGDDERFVGAAVEILKGEVRYSRKSLYEIVDSENLPRTYFKNDEYGEVPFTLFQEKDIFLDIYHWNNYSRSRIQDHNFLGALKFLGGKAHVSEFQFEVADDISQYCQTGRLSEMRNFELMIGDTLPIYIGDRLIRQFRYEDCPSVVLVLRTTPLEQQYFNYHQDYKLASSEDYRLISQQLLWVAQHYNNFDAKAKDALKNLLENRTDTFYLNLFNYLAAIPFGFIQTKAYPFWLKDFLELSKTSTYHSMLAKVLSLSKRA